jgi:hypothetical protein
MMIITVQLAGGSKSKYLMINCCPTAVARWRLVAIYAGSRSFCWLLTYYTLSLLYLHIKTNNYMYESWWMHVWGLHDRIQFSWTKRANVFFSADVTVTFHAVHYCDNIRMLYKQNHCYFEKKRLKWRAQVGKVKESNKSRIKRRI